MRKAKVESRYIITLRFHFYMLGRMIGEAEAID